MGTEGATSVENRDLRWTPPLTQAGDAFASEFKQAGAANAKAASASSDAGTGAQADTATAQGTDTSNYIPPVHPRFAGISQQSTAQDTEEQDITADSEETQSFTETGGASETSDTADVEEAVENNDVETIEDEVVDTATDGEELLEPEPAELTPPSPNPALVDERLAWNEEWLASAQAFFADHVIKIPGNCFSF